MKTHGFSSTRTYACEQGLCTVLIRFYIYILATAQCTGAGPRPPPSPLFVWTCSLCQSLSILVTLLESEVVLLQRSVWLERMVVARCKRMGSYIVKVPLI